MEPRNIVIAGGAGFLGQILTRAFSERGDRVVILSRHPSPTPGSSSLIWDGRTTGAWCDSLEGADVLINLAGRSVNCRYHPRNRQEIMSSRVDSTQALGQAVARCRIPPRLWLNSGTATIYRHTYSTPHNEQNGEIGSDPEAKDAFSIRVAEAWEKAFQDCITPSTRKVVLRTAMVFGAEEGGVFRVLQRLTRWGLGGRMGHGRQYVSWIHERDFVRAINWIIEHTEMEGVVNLTAPFPLSNEAMMQIFRKVCGCSIGLPATAWMLEVGAFLLRTETELILKSRRVVPERLLESGFRFDYRQLNEAIMDLQRRTTA